MRELTGATKIRIKGLLPLPRKRELTGDTRIRLSQIKDLKDWREKLIKDYRDPTPTGTVRRWTDGKLHEKTNKGWRVLPHNKENNVINNSNEEKRNRKIPSPSGVATQKQFNRFVDELFKNPKLREPRAVRLPDVNRKLKKQIGIDKNTSFIFSTRYHHISPQRKAAEGKGQDLRIEEYKELPEIIKNAKQAILTRNNGGFKLLFADKKDPGKVNKIIFNKTNRGNYIINVSKVDKYNGFDPKTEKVVGEGVAPSI